jgi:hypothetical protein
MWRVRMGERLSDMVNLTRAKDAAITWARPRGLGGHEVAAWRRRESPAGGPPVAPAGSTLPQVPPDDDERIDALAANPGEPSSWAN